MKNNKSIKQKISEIGVFLLVLVGIFSFFKYKWNSKKSATETVLTAENSSSEIQTTPPFQPSPELTSDNSVQETQVKFEETKVTAEKNLDPLLVKITNFSQAINEKFEQQLREMFKGEQKEELMDKYLALRQERAIQMRELLKTDNSRAANIKVNYEYHNKFYQIIGKDLYVKYLKILKATNDDAKKTKIVLEF